MANKAIKFIKNPLLIFESLGHIEKLNWIPDEIYLKIIYVIRMKRSLNLKNPKTYNEKLQWLKLYDRNPKYTKMVDKYLVKEYISKLIGEEYIIPTLGVWDNFDEINFEELPNKFVLKCTHDSGGVVICNDKNKLDLNICKNKLNNCLKYNYFWGQREWPYKDLKPRIIAEKYMVDESGYELKDYKFFCFSGKAEYMFITTDRENDTKFDFYDMKFNHLPFTNGYPNSNRKIACPKELKKMIELAELVSKDILQVRVDFYEVDGKIYFGEITFSHWSGMVSFKPEKWDRIFGDLIKLPFEDKCKERKKL